MQPLEPIILFCDVARERSVSRAAELHGVTQSAVSQRLAALEKELGVQLIDRSKRPLQLTPAGQTYHQGCRQIIEQYEQLRRRVTAAEGQPGGEIRVAAIYSAGIDLLNQAAERFEQQAAGTQVHVHYHQPDEVYQQVRGGRVDLGILSYPERWRDLASIPLRQEVMAVVCRAGHPLGEAERLTPAELDGVPLVQFDPALPISRRINAYLRRHGIQPPIAHTFDNIDTIKVYLAHSDEVAILPRRTVRREVETGALAAVTLEPELTRPLAIVYQRQRQLTPLIKSFVEHLTEERKTETSEPTMPAATAGKTSA